MSKQIIRVAGIKDTRNPEFKQLELRATTQKPASANPVGFFLQGSTNSGNNSEERVHWQTVSTAFIEKYGITVGTSDFNALIARDGQEVKLVVLETHTPMRKSYDGQGNLVDAKPKKVPNLSFDVYMVKGELPIYRTITLETDPAKFGDTYIQADPLPQEIRDRMATERAQKVNVVTSKGVVAEPTLD